MYEAPLKVLFVSAEVAPFAKTGGLGDVVGALPTALRRLGHDARVVMPGYASIDFSKYAHTYHGVHEPLRVPVSYGGHALAHLSGLRFAGDTPLYFVGNHHFYGRSSLYGYDDDDARFIFLSRAALELVRYLDWKPDIIHCHDWHTAIMANYLKTLYRHDPLLWDTASVLTIHNLAYQGICSPGALQFAELAHEGLVSTRISSQNGVVNLMGRGIMFADAVNAVSPRYAEEILTSEFGAGLEPLLRANHEKLFGIVNGIDFDEWNPATDTTLAARFDADQLDGKMVNKLALQAEMGLVQDPQRPLMGLVTRLTDQKGIDLLKATLDPLLQHFGDLSFVLLGSGANSYEDYFRDLARRYPGRVGVRIGFDVGLSRRIYAGCDMFVMPSRFEPCGLAQLISLRYGTLPIVRATGGLADTVHHVDRGAGTGNGFVFEHYDGYGLFWAIDQALALYHGDRGAWMAALRRGMREDHTWESSAQQYTHLYRHALHRLRSGAPSYR